MDVINADEIHHIEYTENGLNDPNNQIPILEFYNITDSAIERLDENELKIIKKDRNIYHIIKCLSHKIYKDCDGRYVLQIEGVEPCEDQKELVFLKINYNTTDIRKLL